MCVILVLYSMIYFIHEKTEMNLRLMHLKQTSIYFLFFLLFFLGWDGGWVGSDEGICYVIHDRK